MVSLELTGLVLAFASCQLAACLANFHGRSALRGPFKIYVYVYDGGRLPLRFRGELQSALGRQPLLRFDVDPAVGRDSCLLRVLAFQALNQVSRCCSLAVHLMGDVRSARLDAK